MGLLECGGPTGEVLTAVVEYLLVGILANETAGGWMAMGIGSPLAYIMYLLTYRQLAEIRLLDTIYGMLWGVYGGSRRGYVQRLMIHHTGRIVYT